MAPEKTFRAFSQDQGAMYAQARLKYHPQLYQRLLSHHGATGGDFDTVLDVGCGPGTAISSIHTQFQHAIGVDPSPGMIQAAQSLFGDSNTSTIRFVASTAEDLASIPDGSVDLIIAANAAHWFDMARFWARAAQVVKPAGTVAMWGGGPVTVGSRVRGRAGVQAAIDRLEARVAEFYEPGNQLVRGLYADLALPWTLAEPVAGFERASFVRWEWGTDTEGAFPAAEMYERHVEVDLESLGKIMDTASPVIRWREAHPDAVGTETDVVSMLRSEIEQAMRDAGCKEEEEMRLEGGVSGCMLVVKRGRGC